MKGRPVGIGLAIEPPASPRTGSVMWLGRSLADAQERALLLAGVRPELDDPSRERVVFDEGTAFNAAGIEQLLALGRARQEPVQLVMPGLFGGLIEEASGGAPPFLAAYLPGDGAAATREYVLGAARAELELPDRSLDVPVPVEAFGADFVSIPLSDAFFFPTHQWTQALWANLLGLSPFLWRELAGYTWPTVLWRICCAVVRTRSIRPERVLTGLRHVGKGAVVDSGAILEGSWIGRDVRIGAGAVVRGCVVGDGAVIESGAFAEYSVLGPGAHLEGRARVAFCVVDQLGHCGGDLLMSYVGPEARVDNGVVLRDIGAERTLQVHGPSGTFTPPLGRIGVGLGARARVREGCLVAASIFLPPGCDVAAVPAARLERVPDVGEGEFVIADGGLVPR